MSTVVLDAVWKYYNDDEPAVQNVSLSIQSGEFVVLVGPSGCGKSTTLRMIAGLESISRGTISIDGRVVNDVPPKNRNIAMVFQNYALYPHMTVEKNIGFALKIGGMPRDEIKNRVRKTSQILGLDGLLKRKPGALSGGQRQRVALGRAIARDPAVYLFDEPLSNLDAKLRITMRSELKALHRRLGTTTVYVTHDQEEAMTLGSRLVVMADGRVQQIGSPLDVYNEPVNRFVAGFVGSPTMNFFEGTIRFDGDSTLFVADESEGRIHIPISHIPKQELEDGQRAILGFRPQAVVPEVANDSGIRLATTVQLVEPLGDQVDLLLELSDRLRFAARVRLSDLPEPGSPLDVHVRAHDIMLFQPGEFGQRIGGRLMPSTV